jgi:RNA polymerase sigma-70 factor, ECF subfamily
MEDPGYGDHPALSRSPELQIDLERAIGALPEGARTAFVLHEIEGYQHAEIAAQLGVAEGTVKAQLHRARKLLIEALNR